jgi:uncharacterized protein YukE
MAKIVNKSNQGSGGNVTHLCTTHFNDTIHAYEGHIKTFEDIVSGVKSATDHVFQNWQGRGRDAFEKDCVQVQLQLKDISEIMYDLRDALTNANAEYIKNDLATAKNFES